MAYVVFTMAVFLHVRNNNNNHGNNLRRNRIFRDRLHPLDAYDDLEIKKRYRLSREMIIDLYDQIGADLEPSTMRNHAIPAILQIFGTLRYYASGTFQHVIGDSIGIHGSSVSRIIARVTNAICTLKRRSIKFPRSREDLVATKQGFYRIAQLPNTVGAVDGTLMPIATPKQEEHLYVSRKGFHCLNILAVCDSDMKFTYVVAKYPGASNDAFIWANCSLNEQFQDHDIESGWLIGDSGYVV
jgi:hypothetical protein